MTFPLPLHTSVDLAEVAQCGARPWSPGSLRVPIVGARLLEHKRCGRAHHGEICGSSSPKYSPGFGPAHPETGAKMASSALLLASNRVFVKQADNARSG